MTERDPGTYAPAAEAPCDRCEHRALCSSTGATCAAYVNWAGRGGKAWRKIPRIPDERLRA